MAELLFWPALLAYGEAAVAYLDDARHPGLAGRLATWGVRIGWLVQTALLAVQAARADGFPWSTWAGSLNLFVWLVVGAYLIWGCQPRYRLLGLAVLPLAVVLFILARVGGGTGVGCPEPLLEPLPRAPRRARARGVRGLHARAALSALYLWQERRLKRRERAILRLRAPRSSRWTTLAGPHDRVRAAGAHARDRSRHRAAARPRRRLRRADGRDDRHVGGVRRRRLRYDPRRLARAPGRVSRPRRASRSSSSSGSPFP